ncbi:hypothetical protein PINS_up016454, partial [Pythium insidiosum]
SRRPGFFHLALLVVVDDRFHSTRLFRFRWIYAVITDTVAVAFALRTPDWPSATALLLLKMVFSLITVLSSMCPMNQLSCGPGARASDLCVIGLLALVLVHVARRKTALRTLVRLLLDLRLYRSALLLLLACVWAADTGAYVAGHALSAARYRSFHAIAPHVSPRKDYEGTAVAVACGVLSVSLVAAALQDTHDYNNDNEIGTTTSVTMGGRRRRDRAGRRRRPRRRPRGVKHSGALIPDTGGMLDRVDALLFAALVFGRYNALLLG